MAGVLVLADSVSADSAYTGDAQWVESGLSITFAGTAVNGTRGPNSARIECSLDGVNWYQLMSLSVSAIATYTIGHNINYVRYTHNSASGFGDGPMLVTIKAIQPNNVQVDVDNFPA